MLPSAARLAMLLVGVVSVVSIIRRLTQSISVSTTALMRSRPAAFLVQHWMDGAKRPAGVSMKDFMYQCFLRDVTRGQTTENPAVPKHAGFGRDTNRLRLVSFNVHFFQRGFSGVESGDSHDEVLSLVGNLHPDVMLFQEVPASAVANLRTRLSALGFPHLLAAGSADVHVLPPETKSYPNERLHVVLASRLPLLREAVVPMMDGHAAFAQLDLSAAHPSGAAATPRSVAVYTLHLSVRCEASKRRQEVEAVLAHAAGVAAADPGVPTLIAGDFNQPNECDYPPDEWAAIAKDMTFAKLPLTDGAMDALRAAGYAPSWEVAPKARPLAASSAWNGAVVDYCYVPAAKRAAAGALAVEASYFYHTDASDHLPLVVDFRV